MKLKIYRLDAAAETNTGSTGLHFKSKTLHKMEGFVSETFSARSQQIIGYNLGKSLDVFRSQTTLFASAFQALIPPLAVPMSSYGQEKWVTKRSLKQV